MDLKIYLEKLFKKKVDLLTYKSIHSVIKQRVLSEEVRII